jgi:DNA-binding transcriptional MerR regulator
MAPSLESGWLTLKEAAERIGCHVETLRLRVRTGGLEVVRGPHGRYYVSEEELEDLWPIRRMKRRPPAQDRLDLVMTSIDRLVEDRGRLARWQRALVAVVRDDPAADPPLYRAIAVQALLLAGFNIPETAEQLAMSRRQVRRLRRLTIGGALLAAHQRTQRTERGVLRRAARPVVAELQARLAATGFRAARRDPRSSQSGAQGGRTARIALVRDLNRDQVQDLLLAGLTHTEVAAISLVGIGSDELNELMLNGLPAPGSTDPM